MPRAFGGRAGGEVYREVFNQCEAVMQQIAVECERIVEDAAV